MSWEIIIGDCIDNIPFFIYDNEKEEGNICEGIFLEIKNVYAVAEMLGMAIREYDEQKLKKYEVAKLHTEIEKLKSKIKELEKEEPQNND